ncbi:hypothetical protein EV421DRAFT_1502098 [Armillaria borealis]|uniref:Mid2 domain-containing protein n=1 Tax=Armillaria borealis TaxID=47425 RepID=A0AA39IZ22_9AGAR|nr:hypothetical protein EV421DRAFT_1502098 [Armillaria borealis]
MLVQFILFSFCFAASAGFYFDSIEGNATVGSPVTLTWHLNQDDDPDNLHLERRSLPYQQSGQGENIHFEFPDNGTNDGTLMVNFPSPGDYLIEVFNSNNGPPIYTSFKIGVSSSGYGSNPSSISASASASTSVLTPAAVTSSVVQISSASPSSSSGNSFTISTSFEVKMGGVISDSIAMQPVLSTTAQPMTPTTSPFNTTVITTTKPGSTTTYESSVSPSSSSKENTGSSAIGSPSKIPLIVGATVGSFFFLLLLLVALVYTLRRRKWHRKKYPAIFHRDRMVRKRSNASFSPLTPTAKDPDTYTNSADAEKHASYSSTYKEDLAPSPQPQQGCLEYSLPAPLAPRSETPSPIPAHTDRQMEIYDVLVKKNTDLIRLKTELRRGGDVQEEIEGLKATIRGLEEVLVSPWALGYTDEIPYEASRAPVPN